jgi:hypothetical protein
MKPLIGIVLSLAAFLSGCVSHSGVGIHEVSESRLIGYWFTTDRDQYPGSELQSVCEKRADGTFRIHFAKVSKGSESVDVWDEEGTWLLSEGRIVTVTTMSGGKPCDTRMAYYHDTYIIESLSDDRLVYVHAKNGIRWEATRVDESFTIPKRS